MFALEGPLSKSQQGDKKYKKFRNLSFESFKISRPLRRIKSSETVNIEPRRDNLSVAIFLPKTGQMASKQQQPVPRFEEPPHTTRPSGEECGEINCELCKNIAEKSGGEWHFHWLRLLKDFEVSYGELADSDRQVLLKVDGTDNEVRYIRSRLAIMQTQTVSNDM